jgi:hypothetical protein
MSLCDLCTVSGTVIVKLQRPKRRGAIACGDAKTSLPFAFSTAVADFSEPQHIFWCFKRRKSEVGWLVEVVVVVMELEGLGQIYVSPPTSATFDAPPPPKVSPL